MPSNTRPRGLLFTSAFHSPSTSNNASPETSPLARAGQERNLPTLPATTFSAQEAMTSTPIPSHNPLEARALPPPYSPAGRAPTYTRIDSRPVPTPATYRLGLQSAPSGVVENPTSANASSADDVFPSTAFDRVFLRLQQDFGKLTTESAKFQAKKDEQATKVVSDEIRLDRGRNGIIAKQRKLDAQRREITAEKARLAGERERMERDREVAAVQYATAVKVQQGNEMMKVELVELARKLEMREQSLREKEKPLSPSSSPAATIQRTRELPTRGLAAKFPLTADQDTLPGFQSEVPTVTTQSTPRVPSAGTRTLRRSSTVVHRTTYNNLALWEQEGIAAQREAAEERITSESPSDTTDDQPDENIDPAQICELRHTSSERRDMQRGRSIRRVSGTLSLRERAMYLD